MENPFSYGGFAKKSTFTNRIQEIEQITSLCRNSINLILISPRRWGKSSLIHHIAEKKATQSLKYCTIDMFHIADEKEFYQHYLKAIIKQTATKLTEVTQLATEFLSSIKPKITLGSTPDAEFDLEISFPGNAKSELEILDIAQRIAEKRAIRIVVAIDEFQNIDGFKNSLKFQKKLRATWQKHSNVSYILYGSKRHLMHELFERKEQPFYKFGELLYLPKIEEKVWVNYLVKRFKSTKKSITKQHATYIAKTMECHSFYVQQFAFILWDKTQTSVNTEAINNTLFALKSNNEWRFIHQFENLSNKQRKTLVALIEHGEKDLTSKDTIAKYDLGTSATVIKSIDALQKAEIVERWGNSIHILDPIFKYWLVERLNLDLTNALPLQP